MANDVKVLKLITGEEVIARITKEKNKLISLKKPMTLQMMPSTATGQVGIALVPWMKSGKNEKVTISIEHILVEDEAAEQTEKNYLQIVTGLSL